MSDEALVAKVAVTGEIGERLDAMVEATRAELHRAEGGKEAFKIAASKVLALHAHVDDDIKAGKLPTEELEVAAYAKKYVTRAAHMLENLYLQTQARENAINGEVAALLKSIKVVQHHHDSANAERLRAPAQEAVAALLKQAAPRKRKPKARKPGMHPGQSRARKD